MRLILSLLILVTAAFAQPLTFGVKAGVPLTDNFEAENGRDPGLVDAYSSKTRRYTVGPTATLYLPHRFGVEVDALYRRLDYDRFVAGDIYDATLWQAERTTGNRIDVPVLLRWSPLKAVYAVAGPVFGIHAGFTQSIHSIEDRAVLGLSDTNTTTHNPGELERRVSEGFTVGLGLDKVLGPLHVKPEVRYTNWIRPAFPTNGFLRAETNEVVFLLGFEFGSRL